MAELKEPRKRLRGLLDEPPISLYPSLAARTGVNKAVILQQVHFLIEVKRQSEDRSTFFEGRWWVYNTYEDWQRKYFFWLSVPTVKRLFQELVAVGILLARPCQDDARTRLYTIDDDFWPVWFAQSGQDDPRLQEIEPEKAVLEPDPDQNDPQVGIKLIRFPGSNESGSEPEGDQSDPQVGIALIPNRGSIDSAHGDHPDPHRPPTKESEIRAEITPETRIREAAAGTCEASSPSAGAAADTTQGLIDVEIQRLGLTGEGAGRLRALPRQTAIGLLLDLSRKTATNPAGLLITLLRAGQTPSAQALALVPHAEACGQANWDAAQQQSVRAAYERLADEQHAWVEGYHSHHDAEPPDLPDVNRDWLPRAQPRGRALEGVWTATLERLRGLGKPLQWESLLGDSVAEVHGESLRVRLKDDLARQACLNIFRHEILRAAQVATLGRRWRGTRRWWRSATELLQFRLAFGERSWGQSPQTPQNPEIRNQRPELFKREGATKPDVVAQDVGTPVDAIGAAQEVRIADAPRAAAQHAVLARTRSLGVHLPPRRICPVPVRHPLPHIATQVQCPHPRDTCWLAANTGGLRGIVHRVTRHKRVPPRIHQPIRAPRGIFPFCFSGQPRPAPGTVIARLKPRDTPHA